MADDNAELKKTQPPTFGSMCNVPIKFIDISNLFPQVLPSRVKRHSVLDN